MGITAAHGSASESLSVASLYSGIMTAQRKKSIVHSSL